MLKGKLSRVSGMQQENVINKHVKFNKSQDSFKVQTRDSYPDVTKIRNGERFEQN